jgi:radical SAM superfamily enzyme YgiQ (UPF0313 family)
MKIALVFPPFYLEPMYNMPPLGLINLATVLKSPSRRVKIFDFPLSIRLGALSMGGDIYAECAREILQFEPDVAGFSVQCTTYPPSVGIAGELKKLAPGVKIVFGGHNASFVDELTLSRFPCIDAIARGEGEASFPELIRAFEERLPLDPIDGITFRAGDRIIRNPDRALIDNLDSLPPGDYGFVAPLRVYRDACGLKRSIAILEVGRGCPHRCIYCSQSLIWRRRTRTFSPDRLIRDMKDLAENFGAECFLLAYDQFTAKRGFAERFCLGVIDAGLNRLPWYCISRLDTLDSDLLNLMREAGCESMCYGIDSGSKRTLAFIRKSINHDTLLDRVRETTEAGIVPTLSFVIGFPRESVEDIEATLRLALKSAATGNTNILVQMATVLPGTDLYEKYKHSLFREVDTYFSLGIEFNEGIRIASDDALIDSEPAIFSSFYNVPCPAAPLKDLNDIATSFTVIAAIYPRCFLLLSLELKTPVFDLFFRFLDQVAGIGNASHPGPAPSPQTPGRRSLTPEVCLDRFGDFAARSLGKSDALTRDYFFELLKYETLLSRSACDESHPSSNQVDTGLMGGFAPLCSRKISIEKFTFDIPGVILQMKFGRFPDACARRTVHLVFSRADDSTQVREINEFGYDFLQLCDGRRSIQEIAATLYPKYGADKERDQFASMCAEAAGALAGLELLAPCAAAGS